MVVQLLGLEDLRADGLSMRVGDGGDLAGQPVAEGVVFSGGQHAMRLAALDVEADASVMAAFAPGQGPRPVDFKLGEPRGLLGVLAQRKVTLLDEPFVDANA